MEMTLTLIEEDFERPWLWVAREFVMRLGCPERNAIHPPPTERESNERLAELPADPGHLHENLSVEVLAGRACLCPRHFSRLFKEVFAPTRDLFNNCAWAKRVAVLSCRGPGSKMAASVGFQSADVFRRAFEQQIGLTPSASRAFRLDVERIPERDRPRLSSAAPALTGAFIRGGGKLTLLTLDYRAR
jgi:transcriptional regulator GlxA family with amidase domain